MADIATSSCQGGIKSADSLTLSKILANSGLIKASSWMDKICPIFRAAPRTLHSVDTILSALDSDKMAEEESGNAYSYI